MKRIIEGFAVCVLVFALTACSASSVDHSLRSRDFQDADSQLFILAGGEIDGTDQQVLILFGQLEDGTPTEMRVAIGDVQVVNGQPETVNRGSYFIYYGAITCQAVAEYRCASVESTFGNELFLSFEDANLLDDNEAALIYKWDIEGEGFSSFDVVGHLVVNGAKCDFTGKTLSPKVVKECSLCKGTGLDPTYKISCPECEGMGYLFGVL